VIAVPRVSHTESTAAKIAARRGTQDGERPLVSVVVVNWNGLAYLPECLDSLAAQSYPALEVIVVDNGSTDGSVEYLRGQRVGRLHLVESPVNLGFAGGNNLGIRASKGAYLALLNNDAAADSRWVEALVAAAEAAPGVGMCASRIYVWNRPGILDGAGLLVSGDGIGRGRGRLESDGERYEREADVLLPSACAALYRRSMLDEIGLFDEEFFAYCEDTDLGLRARIAGWRCRYVPGAVVRHHYSGSTGPHSPFKAFQVERNRIWVVVKCFPPCMVAASLVYTLGRYALQLYSALSGRGAAAKLAAQHSPWALARIIVRAWWAALVRLPEMWRRRRAIRWTRKISRREHARLLRAHRVGLSELALKD
jgi:GT2 family glycosyltransferase